MWLAAQVPEEQLPQMREMLDSVSEFCKKTRLWDKPITEASNAEFVRRMKKHIRSNRVFSYGKPYADALDFQSNGHAGKVL